MSNNGFYVGGKTEYPGEKPLGADKGTNKLSPRMASSPGIESEPYWWKASAVTTSLTLLPMKSRFHVRNVAAKKGWNLAKKYSNGSFLLVTFLRSRFGLSILFIARNSKIVIK